jgi:hypothetical protein
VIPNVISADGHTVQLRTGDGATLVETIYFGNGEVKTFPDPIDIGEALPHMPLPLRKEVLHHVRMHLERARPHGPIRPPDAVDGWTLAGDDYEWRLIKRYGPYIAVIKAYTSTTCIGRVSGGESETALLETGPRLYVKPLRTELDKWLEANR